MGLNRALTTAADPLIKSKIKQAPSQPGCYIFLDRHGSIVYVGKAKNLRNRVMSYFAQSGNAARLEYL